MSLPRWPKVTLFDDPDEEMRAAAMRDALRAGTFDESEFTLGKPPGFATLLADPPVVPRRYDSHGLESEDDGTGPFDALKRYAQATRHEGLSAQDAPVAATSPQPTSAEDALGPVTMNPNLFSKPTPAQLANKDRVEKGFERFADESLGQAIGGVNDAVYHSLKTLDPIVEFLEEKVGHLPRYTHPGVKPAETGGGAFIRDISRFLTGFVPVFHYAKWWGAGHRLASVTAAGTSEAITRNPVEENLSNLVEKYPALSNPITRSLASDPSDPELFARLKKGVEGAILAGILEGGSKGVEWLGDKSGLSTVAQLSDGIAHAVKLIGLAGRAGKTVEELVLHAARGGTHSGAHKGLHGVLEPHPEDRKEKPEPEIGFGIAP
jgi:hypothetical protein